MRRVDGTVALLLAASVATGLAVADSHCDLEVNPGESAQAAVDCAAPGDVVLLKAGVHNEALMVTTDGLVIRGEGPELTVLEGLNADGSRIPTDGILVLADGVTVEHLTIQDFGRNGVLYEDVTGFLVDDVVALHNGPYGVYAIRSTEGAFRNSKAVGHSDSGFYLGEVEHCDCVIEGVAAHDNLIGYSGTGASDIVIRDSEWFHNAAGIVPNVLPSEPELQRNLLIEHNLVYDNNNGEAAERWHFSGGFHVPSGLGIVVAGGVEDVVRENTVTGHARAGIAVVWLFMEPSFNQVLDNVLEANALDILWDEGGVNNCFEGNVNMDGAPASFSAGPVWGALGHLPDCDTPNAGAPSPVTLARLVSLVGFGCEPEQQPGPPCHTDHEGGEDDGDY